MLMILSFQWTDVFFALMVMPFSFSKSMESMARSSTRSLARKTPPSFRSLSTSVVLPWSTWAIMAILRMLWFIGGRGRLLEKEVQRARQDDRTQGGRRDADVTPRNV